MIVYVNRLKSDGSGRMPFELAEDIIAMDHGGERVDFSGPVQIKGSVDRDGDLIIVTGEVQTEAILQCSRCLRTVRHSLRAAFKQEYSETGDGEDVLPAKVDRIDLEIPVRESILLELPVKVLCTEECRGLCPVCGADRNEGECGCKHEEIDPRMQRLKELLEE
ncbi:MAG: YceD family protein [Clostridia bacterium]|jgi:uncharacterized protein|nr:DUF177 domain-containing protein [Clostridiales bacterium]